jgi:hypothetical protein
MERLGFVRISSQSKTLREKLAPKNPVLLEKTPFEKWPGVLLQLHVFWLGLGGTNQASTWNTKYHPCRDVDLLSKWQCFTDKKPNAEYNARNANRCKLFLALALRLCVLVQL